MSPPPGAPPSGPVVPETFGGDREIRFRCRKGIACWNACCSNIDITLTPYDVVRLKRRLGLDSAELLRRHTFPYEMEKDGLPGVKLKPVEGGTACPFMRPEGCAVYEDRPTACRYYPVALLAMRKQGEGTDRDSYALVKEAHCLGHQEPRTITVDDYRREQGLAEYDALARGWRQLVLKKLSSGPTVGKPSRRSLELFFTACYDLDRFRVFVASDAFAELYEVPGEEMRRVLADDTELMLFAFRFLRQVMFGEATIPMRAAAVAARRERARERALERERLAAEQYAAETGEERIDD
ncbi:MAG TPA: YkgJ family cysteine cluster protein [Usitatibacter sp.]|nr:YkgJ family cysteine cluster protein [Usitatibacter sp.]